MQNNIKRKINPKKAFALITVLVLVSVIAIFLLCLSWVVDSTLRTCNFYSKKAASLYLAKAAIEYYITNPSEGSWQSITSDIYTSTQIQVYSPESNDPYYIEIQNTKYGVVNQGDYLFIGIIKDVPGGKELSRRVLKVPKPLPGDLAEIRKMWTVY